MSGAMVLASLLVLPLSRSPILPAGSPATMPAQAPTRALVTVKTLVIDGMGTRTVDTDSARVPFGSKGLLMKRVPYAGPMLSFRLAVLAGAPQEAGLPLTRSAEIWSGDVSHPPPDPEVSRREEATVLAAESSYLFEIDHDLKTDRRIVLSVMARPIGEEDLTPSLSDGMTRGLVPVTFLIEVVRESGGVASDPDIHELSAMSGRQVTYSSGVRTPSRPGAAAETIGLTVAITPEQIQGRLLTIKVELSGSEYVDEARTRVEPIRLTEVQTVSSGSRLEVHTTVPAQGAAPAAPPPKSPLRPVTYRVTITPSLGS